jgi:5-methyltetrahydropteroyltriglutamate--homocysteine methyltransferase
MGSRVLTHNLGYPRMGALRELKKSLEAFWKGREHEADLHRIASDLRRLHWLQQKEAGIDLIPSNDFSFYDHVLDTSAMVGAVPERFGWNGSRIDLSTYFAMARGKTTGSENAGNDASGTNHSGVHAMEMTKWFDTNYHFIVPEFYEGQKFTFASAKPVDEFQEALSLGIKTKPVLLGPFTFLKLGKIHGKEFDRYRLLPDLTAVYLEVLRRLADAQAEWVQFDEPAFALDLTPAERSLLPRVYAQLVAAVPTLKFLVATYFDTLGGNLSTFADLPVHALHVDATQSEGELKEFIPSLGPDKILSLGVISGRNIWRNDYRRSLVTISQSVSFLGTPRVWLAPSCSLLHVPFSLRLEQKLNPEIKSWLAFAEEKLVELAELRRACEGETELVARNRILLDSRAASALIHRPGIKERSEKIGTSDIKRRSPYAERNLAQREHLRLPDLPTTTIGSFPQTEDVRTTRAHYRKGKISLADYEVFLEKETTRVIRWQDEIGLDVLVHGEFERTDMRPCGKAFRCGERIGLSISDGRLMHFAWQRQA